MCAAKVLVVVSQIGKENNCYYKTEPGGSLEFCPGSTKLCNFILFVVLKRLGLSNITL